MTPLDVLKEQFNGHAAFTVKRPGILQLHAPLFHEDGDMIDIFLDLPPNGSNRVRISDHGLTLMRLSYTYDIDTPNKRRVFDRIVAENGLSEQNGVLSLDTSWTLVYPAVLQFAQTIAKVTNMRLFKREVIQSLFYEMLGEFIETTLVRFHPQASVTPVADRDDLEVDYVFPASNRPIYLFGVRDNDRARLVTISCLEFQRNGLPFKSVVVHDDFERLSAKDRTRITNAADKQFPTLDLFRESGERFFERETAA